MRSAVIALVLMLAGGVAQAAELTVAEKAAMDRTLDTLHDAAARADGPRYFATYAPGAVFIGTDVTERWTLAEFRAFAEPFFSKGRGWTYRPRQRWLTLTDDPWRCIAWFDEVLDSESYGTTRGVGVLILADGDWKVAQYALSFPVPNDLAKGIVAEIKAYEARKVTEQK